MSLSMSLSKKRVVIAEAIDEVHQELQANPNNPALHIELGDLLMDHFDLSGGSREDAIAEYRTAVYFDPSAEEALLK